MPGNIVLDHDRIFGLEVSSILGSGIMEYNLASLKLYLGIPSSFSNIARQWYVNAFTGPHSELLFVCEGNVYKAELL